MRTIEEVKTIANEMNKPLEILLYEMLSDAMKELDQYKNNWEELKKFIEENKINISLRPYSKYAITIETILNKMKELEEDK